MRRLSAPSVLSVAIKKERKRTRLVVILEVDFLKFSLYKVSLDCSTRVVRCVEDDGSPIGRGRFDDSNSIVEATLN